VKRLSSREYEGHASESGKIFQDRNESVLASVRDNHFVTAIDELYADQRRDFGFILDELNFF
jgi:hypothetical protein